jgi:hypothetical protein
MSIFWQAVDDEVQMLARIFLAIFVLIGLIPFFQKSFARWHDYIITLRRPQSPGLAASITQVAAAPAEPLHMNGIEYLVFVRLSQAGARGASPSSLTGDLHMESLVIRKALQSLHEKGLVRITPGVVIGRRFSLSQEGLALAVAEGLTLKLSRIG